MSDLLKLAERCEAATGPDRELNARIWCHLKGHRFIKIAEEGDTWGDIEGNDRRNTLTPGWAVFENHKHDRWNARFQQYSCEGRHAYTASIDAAMTLVPEGWLTHLTEYNQRTWDALLHGPLVNDKREFASSRTKGNDKACAEPALALCAAALRARSEAAAVGGR